MPKVRFNLQNPKEKETYIRLVFRYDGQRLVYYTGDKIPPSCWNASTMRMRRTAVCRNADAVNQKLEILADKAQAIYLDYWNRGEVLTAAVFRAELDAFRHGRVLPKTGPLDLFGFFDEVIAERAASPDYTPGTITVYKTALTKLKQYQTQTRRPVGFDSVDLDFHAKFVAWMAAQGFKPNYVNKVITTLKTFLALAVDRGLTTNNAFRSRRFTVKKESVEHIYLTEGELQRLADLDLTADARLDRVRDLFLLGCYTGLRFSDYAEIRPENITVVEGVRLLRVTTQKTRRVVSIPILEQAQRILDKRSGRPPGVISNQKFNSYIKELCRTAGIDSGVVVTSFVDGLRVSRTVPKWSLVASHTARRSFASNEYLRAMREGRSYRLIMDITGHRTEKEFFKYIRVAADEKALLFAKGRAG